MAPLWNVATNFPAGIAFWSAMFILFFPISTLIYLGICVHFIAIVAGTYFLQTSKPRPVVNWWEEIVVITGGAHGLGKLTAETLAAKYRPKKVVVLDIASSPTFQNRIAYYPCDVTDFAKVSEVSERIVKEIGQPTILINNAGVVNGKPFLDLSEKEILKTINVNVLGPMWTTKAILPGMKAANKGHIVNIASLLALTGVSYVTDYCASKHAIAGFHEALRQELSQTDIQMTCVYPGLIDTGMFTGVKHTFQFLTPHLQPEDVANAIIKALKDNRSSRVLLPFYVNLVNLLFRGLPIEILDWAKNATFANTEMAGFTHSASDQKKTN